VRAPDSTVGDHYQRSGFSHDEVFLLGRTPDSRSIVAHEIGHAIMDDIYEDAYPATPNCSGHKVDTASSAGCAWTEGSPTDSPWRTLILWRRKPTRNPPAEAA
jgi:hypothetical protein